MHHTHILKNLEQLVIHTKEADTVGGTKRRTFHICLFLGPY